MPMPTQAELHELREAWIRAPRGRRLSRERALREAVAAALREELAVEPNLSAPADESGKPYYRRGQYA